MIILTADGHAFLPGEKTELCVDFQQEPFNIAQDGGFQIAFAKAVGETQESEDAGIAEHKIGSQAVGFAELFEFLADQGVGPARDSGAFEEHTADAVAEGADAPSFHPAQFGVELAPDRVVEIEDFFEVAPAHVLSQFRGFNLVGPTSANRIVWKRCWRLNPEPWVAVNCLDSGRQSVRRKRRAPRRGYPGGF
jgi:hypothetical protein